MHAVTPTTILVASRDPHLADVRKTVLERAGFAVLATSDALTVRKACTEGTIHLVMLGYSLAPADKRRIWRAAREYCKVPILELHRKNAPEVVDQNVFYHEANAPDDFLEAVKRLTSNLPS